MIAEDKGNYTFFFHSPINTPIEHSLPYKVDEHQKSALILPIYIVYYLY